MDPADSGISDPGTAEAWPVSRPGARPWSLPGAWSATPMWGPGAVVYGETGGVGDLNTNNETIMPRATLVTCDTHLGGEGGGAAQ